MRKAQALTSTAGWPEQRRHQRAASFSSFCHLPRRSLRASIRTEPPNSRLRYRPAAPPIQSGSVPLWIALRVFQQRVRYGFTVPNEATTQSERVPFGPRATRNGAPNRRRLRPYSIARNIAGELRFLGSVTPAEKADDDADSDHNRVNDRRYSTEMPSPQNSDEGRQDEQEKNSRALKGCGRAYP
jgi:hypothetical protein